jgi:sporulation protein YlmC with PRC-barrel domain
MLNKANTLQTYTLQSLDGAIGEVKDFYFDDFYWTVRYLVAETGNWLTGRQVLISPHALHAANKKEQKIVVALTKKQIEDSPSLNTDKPVSRQFEDSYHGYYGWPMYYWGGPFMWGASAYPERNFVVGHRDKQRESAQGKKSWDPHLRSTSDVHGYHVQATDGEIGHVEDFIIDDKTWAIRYLIIDTRNWLPGKRILISPKWIERVSWSESKVFVNVPRETIKHAPAYTDLSLLTRDYETSLHQHYDRQGYWVEEPDSKDCDEQTNVRPDERVPSAVAQTKNSIVI